VSGLARSALACPACGTELAASLLSCPACQRLLHADALKQMAAEAEQLARTGELAGALAKWRAALELLPPESGQSRAISAKVAELSSRVDVQAPPIPSGPAPGSRAARLLAPLGVLGALLWKAKFLVVFLLGKAKLLLLGLTKGGTLLSMLLSFGVYWTAWGWKFALGLIASMYVHEMGHVAALQRLGIKASVPMFVPGFGAFVRMEQYPQSAREDARVGLAGPLWGLGAVVCAWAVHFATGVPIWAAIARSAGWLNLFNLLPVWQLDGGRGFRALSRGQRVLVALVIVALWAATGEGLLALLAIAAVVSALAGQPPREPDRVALVEYLVVLVALSVFGMIPVHLPGHETIPGR
jgi:Zn-dependent protease